MSRESEDLFSSIKRANLGNDLYFNEELDALCSGLDSALVLNTTNHLTTFNFIRSPCDVLRMSILYSVGKTPAGLSFKIDTSLIKQDRPTSFTFLMFASREVFLEIIKEKFPTHFEMFLWHPELLNLK